MAVDLVTFGCRLNAYESEVMRHNAGAAGLNDAGAADTVIVNTCAVTAEAVRQARQTIRRLRRDKPHARIVVTGCAAQTEPETFAAMAEVDRVLGNREKLEPEMATQFNDRTGVFSGAGGGNYLSNYEYFPLMSVANRDLEVFGVRRIEPMAFVPVRERQGDRVVLGAGGACGLREGSQWAIFPTGTKAVPPGQEPGPGQIVYSNGFALAALARRQGAFLTDLGLVADRHRQ